MSIVSMENISDAQIDIAYEKSQAKDIGKAFIIARRLGFGYTVEQGGILGIEKAVAVILYTFKEIENRG